MQIEPAIHSANEYIEFVSLKSVSWNEWPIGIAHNYTSLFRSILGVLSPFSFWKHNKFSSFSYSVVSFSSRLPTCSHLYHAKPPDFPLLFEPRVFVVESTHIWGLERTRGGLEKLEVLKGCVEG